MVENHGLNYTKSAQKLLDKNCKQFKGLSVEEIINHLKKSIPIKQNGRCPTCKERVIILKDGIIHVENIRRLMVPDTVTTPDFEITCPACLQHLTLFIRNRN